MKNIVCPKCQVESGDSWGQCAGSCPMPMSPHFTTEAVKIFGKPKLREVVDRVGLEPTTSRLRVGCSTN